MKRLIPLTLTLLVSLAAFAADPPKPQLFLLHEEVANVSMIPQYEAVTKDLIKAFTEKKVTSPSFNIATYMTNDMHYLYMTPIANWAQIDSIWKDWMSAGDVVGKEKWADIMKRGGATMSSYSESVVALREDLSYKPETPRIKEEDERYARLDFYYLMPGTEMQSEQIAKDFVALFREKKIADRFQIYTAMSGTDLPLLVAVIPAKSPADFAAADEKNTAILGDALRALQGRAMAVSRRIERKDSWFRPDLSYMPK